MTTNEQTLFKGKLSGWVLIITVIVTANLIASCFEEPKPTEAPIETVKIRMHVNCTTMWECEYIYTDGCINLKDKTTTCLQG